MASALPLGGAPCYIPNGVLLLKHSHNVVPLTPDNTAHSGDNTLWKLGANCVRGGLLSKAAFTHRTVQQVTDLYKPYEL